MLRLRPVSRLRPLSLVRYTIENSAPAALPASYESCTWRRVNVGAVEARNAVSNPFGVYILFCARVLADGQLRRCDRAGICGLLCCSVIIVGMA